MKLSSNDLLTVDHVEQVGFHPRSGISLTGVSTDSRTTKPGDLFIALRGENFNGHNFVSKAVEMGARVVLVENNWATMNPTLLKSFGVPVIVVENCVHALGQLARTHRRKFKIPILAVAGSNGKTTTKEMVAAVLKTKYKALTTEGNLNNHIGVPLTLFRLEKKHQVAVVEIGTNHFGEIRYLSGILEPTHALLTNIGHEHLEFLGDLEGVAKAEGEVFDWIKERKGSTAFVNRDDRHVDRKSRGISKQVTFGVKAKSVDVKGSVVTWNQDACAHMRITARRKKSFELQLSVPGYHNALNALAAAAVGITFRVPTAKIQKSLAAFTAASNRMQLLKIDGISILNDTYNSNPDSAFASLQTLGAIRSTGKKIAVLADMLELGNNAEEAHRSVGESVAGFGIEYLLTYGNHSKATHDAAAVKFKAHYEQKNVLAEYLAELIHAGDVVLIKGSRGMTMESIVTFLHERLQKAA